MIQIVIKQNHQSGRDSHLRQGFGHWIHFPISDLFSIGRREITRKKNGLLEFNSLGVSIFGAVASVFFIEKTLATPTREFLMTNEKSVFLARNRVPKI